VPTTGVRYGNPLFCQLSSLPCIAPWCSEDSYALQEKDLHQDMLGRYVSNFQRVQWTLGGVKSNRNSLRFFCICNQYMCIYLHIIYIIYIHLHIIYTYYIYDYYYAHSSWFPKTTNIATQPLGTRRDALVSCRARIIQRSETTQRVFPKFETILLDWFPYN